MGSPTLFPSGNPDQRHLSRPALSGQHENPQSAHPWKSDGRVRDGIIEGLFFLLGLLAFGSLLMGIFAFTRPATRTVPEDIQYTHAGVFAYSAPATPGIYDTNTIQSGEPIFLNLNCSVNVVFKYALISENPQNINGVEQISVRVTDETSGWQRSVLLKSPEPFSGTSFNTNADLNLCELLSLTQIMEQGTEYFPVNYTLRVIPQITVTGKLGELDLNDSYEPALVFRFNKQQAYLVKNNTNPLENTVSDPLNPSETRLLRGTRIEANTLPILGLEPEVGSLRSAAVVGLVVSLSGIILLGMGVAKIAHDRESYVRMKYGSMVAEVNGNGLDLDNPASVIDLASIDDLAKLADRKNAMILHETRGLIHYYLVQGDGIYYRVAYNGQDAGWAPILPKQAEEELRQGFERGEFRVYYQPIISLDSGKITAVEALLRWQHPQRGLVSAREFMPTVESSGLIEPIGKWMLNAACAQLRDWQLAGASLTLSVNLAESQLEHDAAKTISRVLKNTGVDPNSIQVEIAERGILKSAYKLLPRMQELRHLGLKVSIDNFDGQLPASSIRQYPVNSIKIDRRLVQSLGDMQTAATLTAMAATARATGVNVVAVGVETEAQLAQLESGHFTQVQGMFFGDPVPAGEITDRLFNRDSLLTQRKNNGRTYLKTRNR